MARGSVTPRRSKDGKRVSYRVKWESRGPNGERVHHSATRATKKAADAFLADKLKEVNDGTFIKPSNDTLGAFLDRWLNAAHSDWSEATTHEYSSIVRNRIKPHIGSVPLARLDDLTIQECYTKLHDAGYAKSSVKLTHAVLHNALDQAVKRRLLSRNPSEGVSPPSPSATAPNVWDAQEAATFLTEVDGHRFAPLWRLALDSGMRIGEILVLQWRDVDLDKGIVSVQRTLTGTKDGARMIGEYAKTSTSRRPIAIAGDTVKALRPLRPEQNLRRLKCGAGWHDLGLMFDRGNGNWIDPSTVRASLERAIKKAKVPRLTHHGMRHTMATMLLAAGVHPKVVQERMGHRSIQMTLDRYSHVAPNMQRDAADVLNQLLRKQARPKRGHEAG